MAYRSAPLYEDVIWRTHLQPQDPTLAQAVRATIAKHREHLLEFIRLDEPAPLNAMTLAQWSSPNVLSSLLAVYSDHIYRYGQVEVPLPPGADVERTTWGISVNKPNAAKQQGQLLEKARNEMGELAYMLPVKELTGTVTFRHLLRFSQKGQFVLPPARYVRSYAPAQQSVAAGSEWTGMQVK